MTCRPIPHEPAIAPHIPRTSPNGGKGWSYEGLSNRRHHRMHKEYPMKNKTLILAALLGLALATSPAAFAGDRDHQMSGAQHRKHMGGLHHPKDGREQAEDEKARPMSDMQHKKHMGGLHHPKDRREQAEDEKARPMSDMQHKKHMGGLHHPSSEDE